MKKIAPYKNKQKKFYNKTGFPVKFCKKCKKSWEYEKVNTRTTPWTAHYYDYFPTIGLKRKLCPKCKIKTQ